MCAAAPVCWKICTSAAARSHMPPTALDQVRPRISVIIAAYNVQGCLARAVQTVQAQDFHDFEILIIDDGSEDGTLKVAWDLAKRDGRIRVLALGRNQGPSAARNRGLEEARGEWASILDADDAFLPERLGHLLTLAERRRADMVADDLLLYDAGAERLLPPAFGWTEEQLLTLDWLLSSDASPNTYPLGWVQPVWRVAFLRANALAYPVQYRYMEDFFLLASSLLCGAKVWLSPRAGYVYTLRHGPISQQGSRFSRTQPTLRDLRAVCEALVARYRNALSRTQLHGLRKMHHEREIQKVMAEALALRRRQGRLAALCLLWRHPSAAWRLAALKMPALSTAGSSRSST